MSCKPETHVIPVMPGYKINVVVQDNGSQRYTPQRWVTDPKYAGSGWWESLIPDGTVRLTLREARNDCARAAGLEEV